MLADAVNKLHPQNMGIIGHHAHFLSFFWVAREVVASCRGFTYFLSLPTLLFDHIKHLYVDTLMGDLHRTSLVPIPSYLCNSRQLCSLMLTLCCKIGDIGDQGWGKIWNNKEIIRNCNLATRFGLIRYSFGDMILVAINLPAANQRNCVLETFVWFLYWNSTTTFWFKSPKILSVSFGIPRTCTLVLMFSLEPILWCLGELSDTNSPFEMFTTNCPAAKDLKNPYSVCAAVASLFYWLLLTASWRVRVVLF